MQHAAASPIPMPQFASLSLVLNHPSASSNNNNNNGSGGGGMSVTHHPLPFLVVAPTCHCTSHMAIAAIEEVQDHIHNILLSSHDSSPNCSNNNDTNGKESNDNYDYTRELLQEEAQSILRTATTIQVYRPLSTNGMAMHYRFLDGRNNNNNSNNSNGTTTATPHPDSISIIPKLQSLLLSSSMLNMKIDLSGKILGVLLCVATTGGSSTICSASSLSYTLCQRMNDCITHLQQLPQQQPNTTISNAKELLTSYLLTDDEWNMNNSVLPTTTDYIQLPHGRFRGTGGIASTMTSPLLGRITTPIAEFGFKAARRASTGIVRGVMMNVGPTSTTTMTGMNAPPSPPVETGFPLLLRPNAATASRSLMDQLTILSVTEHTTFLRKYEQSGQERKANLDLTGGTNKSRFRRRRTTDTTRDADFDHFDYKGPPQQSATTAMTTTFSNTETGMLKGIPTTTTASTMSSATMNSPVQNAPGKVLPFKSSAKDTKRGPSSRRPATTSAQPGSGSTNGEFTTQPKPSVSGGKLSDRIDPTSNSHSKRIMPHHKMDTDDMTYDSRSQQSSGHLNHTPMDNGSVMSNRSSTTNSKQQSTSSSVGKLQINIALNEDLSCSYKLSQLSTCSVDGIVQVQVKSSVPIAKSNGGIPFALILKDPMTHIESLNENPKYATKTASNNTSSFHNDCFNVIIPEQEKYFSLLKYRCKNDLRPVPIRVQAKVKADGTFCRVALQISSNPNNESKLTDLTITMGVPIGAVVGDSLVTQPAGGVYDTTKSSVIWCVSELGCGEKFQLQARFDMIGNDRDVANDADLSFPVLVRCQCLHVQLSGVGFDVRPMNSIDASPPPTTDMIMKIASRFRLSHREKNI